jgi:hypothetical protein
MAPNWYVSVLTLVGLSGLHIPIVSGETSGGVKNLQDASPTVRNSSHTHQEVAEPVPYWFEAYNLLDPAQILLFVRAQTLPANLDDTFPVGLLPRLNPFDPKFVLKRCERADVGECLTYGKPLPQGQIPPRECRRVFFGI